MLLLFSAVLMMLGFVHWVTKRRAASLANAYAALAVEVNKAAQAASVKPGNGAKHDVCIMAKAQYELGRLVQARDRAEGKALAWQASADAWANRLEYFRDWKGRKLPYTLGVLDVGLAMWLLDYFGVGELINARHIVQMARVWMTGAE